MSFQEKMQGTMERFFGPLSKKLSDSHIVKAISSGVLATMPVTLGVSAICIITNLPIPGWIEWLTSIGLYSASYEVMQATLSLLAIYIVGTISYNLAKIEGENGLTALVISMGCFLLLIPQYITGENYFFTAMESKYLGSDGVFVGIVLSIVVTKLYCFLMKKNIKLSMPDSVPPMVTNSLSPTFAAMIIFTLFFFIKWGITFTSYGNLFTMINTMIATPIMSFGATPSAVIIVYTLSSLLWFFGIHPSSIMGVYTPIMAMAITSDVAAFTAGKPLPYLAFEIVAMCVYIGGSANMVGLGVAMLKAKSERFKALRPIAFIPSVFNIVEPILFGVPCMLNPIFFIPMILATCVPGIIGLIAVSFLPITLNPTISLPWVTPVILTAFMKGGLSLGILIVVCSVVVIGIYYPFFKVADNQALKEELEMKNQQELS